MKSTYLFFIIALSITPRITLAATDISPRFWNDYRGMSYLCAMTKEPLKKCEVELAVDTHGVTLGQYIGNSFFRVKYSRDWILSSKEAETYGIELSGHSRIYGLRESLRSDRPAAWFMFLSGEHNETKVASIQGNTTIPLAIYFPDNAKASSLIRAEYDKVMAIVGQTQRRKDHISTKEKAAFIKTLSSSTIMKSKLRAIRKIAYGIPRSEDCDVEQRMQLLNYALINGEPLVQICTLSKLQNEANSTYAVPMAIAILQSAVNRSHLYQQDVLNSAVDTVIALIAEADHRVKDLSQLLRIFGTTDISLIHKLTKGQISADQFSLLEFASKVGLQTNWNATHISALLEALHSVALNPTVFSAKAVRQARQALRLYTDPFGSCANVLTNGQTLAH